MTASAHAFHHNLHVHFINGTRTYIYLIIVWSQHKRSLHAGDVQKLIGSLGSYYGRALQAFTWTSADCKAVPVDLSSPYNLCSCLIGINVITEHLAHSRNVCTVSSKECSRLKGTHTRAGSKVIGINDHTCVQTVCLQASQSQII